MGTQGQVLALHLLRIFLANDMLVWRNIPLIASPIIRGNAERNAELYERILKKLKEGECQL